MYSDRPNGVPMYEKARSTTKYQGVYIDENLIRAKSPKITNGFYLIKRMYNNLKI